MKPFNKYFDHTCLKPEATSSDIKKLCAEARKHDFYSVCVNGCYVKLAAGELSDSDVRVFFKDKQQQNEKVAGWTDATLVRLGRCYKTMLYEAGIIDKAKTARKILRPILDPDLVRWLEQNNMGAYVKALAGVR